MKNAKRRLSLLLSLSLLLPGLVTSALAAEEETETEAPRPVILAVSVGTGYTDELEKSIGAVEKALADAYPEYEVRRAFAAQAVIDRLAERDGLEIDSVAEALERLAADGVKDVIVQPTHVIEGFAYETVAEEVSAWADAFDSLRLGPALLGSEEDCAQLAEVLSAEMKRYERKDTVIVFVGCGTEHESNAAYAALQEAFAEEGCERYLVGTIGAAPSLVDVLFQVRENGWKKVVLAPLTIAAGDHARNDIAGRDAESWKSVFQAEGFPVECVLKGLGQYTGVQDMIAAHVESAVPVAPAAGEEPAEEPAEEPVEEPAEEPAEEPVEEPAEEPVEEPAEEPVEEPAEEPVEEPAEEPVEEIHEDVPEGSAENPAPGFAPGGVTAADLVPGSYAITVQSSSSQFRVADARLEVENGEMRVVMTMEGRRCGELYMGTAAEAERAAEEDIIPFVWSEDGNMVFTVPVQALDAETDCAAWSIRLGRWLDRILVFVSSALPEEAFAAE